jgi:hypothetical protein
MTLHTMRYHGPNCSWTVGYWRTDYNYGCPAAMWETIYECKDADDALNKVNRLNGGPGVPQSLLGSVSS